MNRHERRAAAAKARKWSTPEREVALKAGKGDLPPEYFAHVETLARCAQEWVQSQPTPPDLRWVEQKDDGVLITGNLDVAAQYLADSPDAFRLLAWVDEKTERKSSLLQMTWALRLLRAIPMPDGSYYGAETLRESYGQERLRDWAKVIGSGARGARIVESACGHCGTRMDGADHPDGKPPRPGDFALCIFCAGFNRYDAELRLVGTADAEVEAIVGPEMWAQLLDMQVSLRGAISKMVADKLGKRERAEA